MLVHRVDVGVRIRADMRTPQGQARIPANVARTGVQLYPQADGSVRREYRPPEEVFHPDSLRTYETATVTEGHPGVVTSENWSQLAKGDVRAPHRDGRFVAADLVIRDKSTLDKIEAGDLQELSCGYDCMLELTPGTSPDGEHYDAIQRSIVVNHIGLGPKDWARAGNAARLRLDGGVVAYVVDEEPRPRPAAMTPEQIAELQAKVATLTAEADRAKARADALEAAQKTDAAKTLAQLEAARDAEKARADRLEALTKPDHVDAIVKARLAVMDGVRVLHGKPDVTADLAGTEREVMVRAIAARDSSFTADGKSDDYVRARFDLAVEQQRKAYDALGSVNRGTAPAGEMNLDGNDAELATLIKRFDSAPERLETYHRAEPWRIGENAALAIAAQVGS
jgi:hypothetical protein